MPFFISKIPVLYLRMSLKALSEAMEMICPTLGVVVSSSLEEEEDPPDD